MMLRRVLQYQQSGRLGGVPKTIIAGFVALVAVIPAYMLGYGIANLIASSGQLNPTITSWFDSLIANPVVNLAAGALYLTMIVHLAAGIIWAFIYVYLFEPRLWGPGWLRGAEFALVPWLLSIVIFLPLVGGGFFGLAIDAGPLPVIGNLVLHLVYGVVLGGSYAFIGRPEWEEGAEMRAERSAEMSASVGIVLGVAIGSAVGIVLGLTIPQVFGIAILGLSPWYFTVAAILIGGAWGGLLGFLAGNTPQGGEDRGS